jgi:hypothetical protein
MRYAEIVEIHNALQTLGMEKLPIAYEIAKNIRRCTAVIREVQEVISQLVQKYAQKDSEGNIEFVEGGQPKFPNAEAKAQYRAELRKIDMDDSYKVDFHRIAFTRIENEKLGGAVLAPLLDHIIVPTQDDVGRKT